MSETSLNQAVATEAASSPSDLLRMVEELRASVQARDDFIAIAAHELRNPMTPILGVAELALTAARNAGDACPPRIVPLLERLQLLVQEYVKRATRLLEVSRIETGNLQLDFTETDISALVRSVVDRYETAAFQGRCTLELDLDEGLVGLWDRMAVEQLVENLLYNALKFGTGKPVTVRLRADGSAARLEIQDRGVGMRPEQTARLFGRFEQVMAQHRDGGFGIGLWIVDRLVTAMNGRVTVSSREGEGSTFVVLLPFSPPRPDRKSA